MTRYTYAWGYRSAEAAENAIEDLCTEGEISTGEEPMIHHYRTRDGRTRWCITLRG